MTPANFQQLSNFIWSVADLLRGPYRPPQCERVMLPLTVLRRFDWLLAPTKAAALKKHAELAAVERRIMELLREVTE
jgi:type I restriction enzyme M protein